MELKKFCLISIFIALAIIEDQKMLAAQEEQETYVEMNQIGRPKQFDDMVSALAFSDQQEHPFIAAACPDKKTYVLNENGAIVTNIYAPAACSAVKFMHCGRRLAVGTMTDKNDDSEVACFDLEKEVCDYTVKSYSDFDCIDGVCEIEFSADDKLGLSVHQDGTLHVWDAREGTIIEKLRLAHRRIRTARFCADNNILLMTDNGTLERHDLDGCMHETFSLAKQGATIHGTPVILPNGPMFLACVEFIKTKKDSSLLLCNFANKKLFQLQGVARISAGACTDDGRLWVSSCGRLVTAIFNLASDHLVQPDYKACCLPEGHLVSSLACHQSQRCVVATWPNIVSLYNLAVKKVEISQKQEC